MNQNILKVLDSREERWEMRKNLAEKYNSTIISITLCIPLALRINEDFWNIFLNLCTKFYKNLKQRDKTANFEGHMRGCDGPAYFISSKEQAEEIKKLCVDYEENIPGARMLDIDVMNSEKIQISRSDIGLPPRKCFICNNPAYLCVSGRAHSPEQINNYIYKLKNEYLSKNYEL